MFVTGDGLLQQKDGLTGDGLKEIFATNLFGHFMLVIKVFLFLTLMWRHKCGENDEIKLTIR